MRLLQIVSDLHLEFYGKRDRPTLIKHGTDLALLGDIGKPFSETYKTFLGAQSAAFSDGQIFVLIGNHEYYTTDKTTSAILEQARSVCAEFPNVKLLERETVDLTEKTTILGCTLWSLCDKWTSQSLNDFVKIKTERVDGGCGKELLPITREIYNAWHRRDVTWLDAEIETQKARGKKVVVLTHHAPLTDMSGIYKGSAISSGFTSDLRYLFRDPVLAFANGHVHSNCDIEYNGIRCVSNAMGYPDEKGVGYVESCVVEIP